MMQYWGPEDTSVDFCEKNYEKLPICQAWDDVYKTYESLNSPEYQKSSVKTFTYLYYRVSSAL